MERRVIEVINFSPGPAALPRKVLSRLKSSIWDFKGTGVSAFEISHRSTAFVDFSERLFEKLRAALAVPSDYAVLLMPGAARLQFSALVWNLDGSSQAAYLDTGFWSRLAGREAEKYTTVHWVCQPPEGDLSRLPMQWDWPSFPCAYIHYTDNETIEGVEFKHLPLKPADCDAPFVCDMTSSLMGKSIHVSDYGMIYAGLQKNLGIAGATLVIVKRSLLQSQKILPLGLDYRLADEHSSLHVTPSTIAWVVLDHILDFIEEEGGVAAMQNRNNKKAQLVYECIADHSHCYQLMVDPAVASRFNIPFHIPSPDREKDFLQQAEQRGLCFLKGHKIAGGIRVSLYNGIDEPQTMKLVQFMHAYAKGSA